MSPGWEADTSSDRRRCGGRGCCGGGSVGERVLVCGQRASGHVTATAKAKRRSRSHTHLKQTPRTPAVCRCGTPYFSLNNGIAHVRTHKQHINSIPTADQLLPLLFSHLDVGSCWLLTAGVSVNEDHKLLQRDMTQQTAHSTQCGCGCGCMNTREGCVCVQG